ncbi:Peptidyl-prolyl cis-trans isomerase A2 [Armadillidium vulgare]|nr:Peptidyl-prolyl cis-trans isomerase A2 [Armadillidium vulgare]
MECGVCFRLYKDEGETRPRSLSCGHTFCSGCVCSILNDEGLLCPTCRTHHEVFKLEHIAINYGLLDILKIVGSPEEDDEGAKPREKDSSAPSSVECDTPVPDDCCAEHGEMWQYRCVPCDKWMCSRCLVVEHLDKGCRVISSRQALEELLIMQRNTSEVSLKFYDAKIVKLAQYDSLLEYHLHKQEILLNGLSELIEKQNHVIKLVREEREQLQSVLEEGKIKRNALDFSLEKTKHADTQREFSYLLKEIRGWDTKLSDWVKISATPFEESETKSISLKYSSVRLLTAVNTPVCFLSLSKDDIYFGRIYIRMLSPSKRSHQFRLLCTGERGPCYKSSTFFSLQKAGEPGECLLGGDYNCGDGTGGTPLLEGIKPGTEYRELVSEGLVAGSNGDHSALFGIFLKDWSGVSDTAFARVIKNLRLLQLAVATVRDIKELKVSDCGVVIPT